MFTLHYGDCLDPVTGLESLADKSVDCAIFDPPYSEHVHTRTRRGDNGFKETNSSRRATFNRSTDLGFEHMTQAVMESTADQIARIVKRWALVFSDIESAHLWRGELEAVGMDHVRTGVWIKVGCTPQFTGDRPAVGCEAITIVHQRGRKKWNGGGTHAVWSYPIVLSRGGRNERIHTTQKPIDLMRCLVGLFTEAGETILDPFAGSATTLVAAESLGRNSIGWEKDPAFYETARRRLNGEECKPAPGQLAMFGAK